MNDQTKRLILHYHKNAVLGRKTPNLATLLLRGSAGSGNFGHIGRPKRHGGSKLGGGLRRIKASKDTSPEDRKKAARALSNRRAAGKYTQGYHEARSQWSANKKFADTYLSGKDHKDFMDEARDQIRFERQISKAARRHGFIPGEMKPRQWKALAIKLEGETKDQLALSTQAQRDAVGNKAKGPKTDWIQIGGKDVLASIGGITNKEADQIVSDIDSKTKKDALDFMQGKLTEYGYSKKQATAMNYNQARKLMWEIGEGEPLPGNVVGVGKTKRNKVIQKATNKQRLEAGATSVAPRSAKGLETWEHYREALNRGGVSEPPYVPDQLWGDSTGESVPKWMQQSKSKGLGLTLQSNLVTRASNIDQAARRLVRKHETPTMAARQVKQMSAQLVESMDVRQPVAVEAVASAVVQYQLDRRVLTPADKIRLQLIGQRRGGKPKRGGPTSGNFKHKS